MLGCLKCYGGTYILYHVEDRINEYFFVVIGNNSVKIVLCLWNVFFYRVILNRCVIVLYMLILTGSSDVPD